MKKDPYAPLREQLKNPPEHWRSLEHKALQPELMERIDSEFPVGLAPQGDFSRREALKLAGASLAFAGLAACIRRPEDEILPYTKMPENVIPGTRQQYATVFPRPSGAVGLLVEAHEGRPTKIEGNPLHPASLGGSDVWAQAEILRLYDPDRARAPLQAGKPTTWLAWDEFATSHFKKLADTQGGGLALLIEEGTGPTFERLLATVTAKYPSAKLYRWDPLGATRQQRGAELAFGPGKRATFDLTDARVILALDSNFLVDGPNALRLARQFGARRAVDTAADVAQMNRLYVAEGVFSTTGACADHRVRVSSAEVPVFLSALAKQLVTVHGIQLGELGGALDGTAPKGTEKFIAALAKDLVSGPRSGVILVGERQSAAVHAVAMALNAAISSRAMSVVQVTPSAPAGTLAELTKSLSAKQVKTLVVVESNPVYTAPGALKFQDALAGSGATLIHAALQPDETGANAAWHLPTSHFLESWDDARAWDGTLSLVQPLILPLFGARSALALLSQLGGSPEKDDHKLVQATWRGAKQPLADNKAWNTALHDGLVTGSAFPVVAAKVLAGAIASALKSEAKVTPPSSTALELVALTGHVLDGRLGNVSWIQELPDSMNKLCWDNALLLSPGLAKELGILSAVKKNAYTSDIVELTVDGRTVSVPTFVLPGMAPHTIAINTGYGRKAGSIATGVGVDVHPLLKEGSVVHGVKLVRTSKSQELCSTQDYFSVAGNPLKEMTFADMTEASGVERTLGLGFRPYYRSATAEQLVKEGGKSLHEGDIPAELVQLGTPKNRPVKAIQSVNDVVYEGQQWGMTIDLSQCIGCDACTVACVSENNIPVVGREQVLLGRELHWIRIDRYFTGDVDEPKAAHQPVPCMQCENAPCEPVCPVGATVHDEEGLNSMAYNRCIGTRYCGNNCPYKVRRFNYLDFSVSGNIRVDPIKAERMKTLKLQRNPDVTVRYRGVMEKCTYCTQRVEEAKIAQKRAGGDRKALPDGAVTPACAQACPTQAIVFGNINDPKSRVAKLKQTQRNYEMLQELNVRPRTTFLARVKNENPELA